VLRTTWDLHEETHFVLGKAFCFFSTAKS